MMSAGILETRCVCFKQACFFFYPAALLEPACLSIEPSEPLDVPTAAAAAKMRRTDWNRKGKKRLGQPKFGLRASRGGTLLLSVGVPATATCTAGSEDALGDMDFKVAGGHDAITAFQMDIKVSRPLNVQMCTSLAYEVCHTFCQSLGDGRACFRKFGWMTCLYCQHPYVCIMSCN
eukprot:1147287-Pelagomonas_calceolata.AAC.7